MADKADRTERPGVLAPPQQKAVAGFDLASAVDLFSKKRKLTEERQQLQRTQLGEIQKQNVQLGALQVESFKSKSAFVDAMTEEIGGLKELNAASDRQRQLTSSNNLLDNLQAMQDAMLSPSMATSEGRAKRRAEINSNVSTLTTMQAVEQDLIAGKMDLVKTQTALKGQKLEQVQLLEAQTDEVINAETERQKTILQGLANNATARELILNDMSRDQIIQARENVDAAGNTVIQGFSFPKAVLDQKLAALDDLAYGAQVKRLQLGKEQAALIQETNKRMLRSLTVTQIQQLKAGRLVTIKQGNEVLELDQSMFDTGDLKQEYEVKTQMRDSLLADEQASMNYGNLQTDIARDTDKYARLYQRSAIGSPLRSAAQERLLTLNSAYAQVAEMEKAYTQNPTPENRNILTQYKRMLGEKLAKDSAKDDALIEAEAKRLGKGNQNLTAANRAFLQGQTVSQEDVLKYSIDSIKKGVPPVDMLGPDTAKLAKKYYDESISKKREEFSAFDTVKGDELKTLVANEAIEQAVNAMVQGQTMKFLTDQADGALVADSTLRDNPVMQLRDYTGERVFTRESFAVLINDADQRGLAEMLKTPQYAWLADKKTLIDDLMAGKTVSDEENTMTPGEFIRSRDQFSNVQFLLSLDAKSPGLASQYVSWWNKNGGTFARQFASQMSDPTKTTSMQESANQTMGSSQVEHGIREYFNGLIDASTMYTDERRSQRMKWVSYDMQPANRQAALLQFDANLGDKERTAIYRGVINPLLAQAEAKKLDYDQTNIFIDEAMANLDNLIPGYKENKSLKAAVTKMLSNRDHVTTQLEALSDSPWLYGDDKKVTDDVWNRLSPENRLESSQTMVPGGDTMNLGSVRVGADRRINKPFWTGNDGWLRNETSTRPYDWFRNLRADDPNAQNNGGM